MLFHFLNFSQCVVCMFGHKTIYKVTNLKVHSKRRYFVKKKKTIFKNYNELEVWTTKLFSCICDITNCKSRLLKYEWLAGGEITWLSTARFKIETQCGCFYITAFLMKTVSGYVCNHGSPSGERDTASPRGHYGERLQRDSCLKKHMKKHHPLAGDSPWRHYRREHNIRTAGRIHHPLLRLKLASEAWPQSLGDAVSRSPLGEPWLHT